MWRLSQLPLEEGQAAVSENIVNVYQIHPSPSRLLALQGLGLFYGNCMHPAPTSPSPKSVEGLSDMSKQTPAPTPNRSLLLVAMSAQEPCATITYRASSQRKEVFSCAVYLKPLCSARRDALPVSLFVARRTAQYFPLCLLREGCMLLCCSAAWALLRQLSYG